VRICIKGEIFVFSKWRSQIGVFLKCTEIPKKGKEGEKKRKGKQISKQRSKRKCPPNCLKFYNFKIISKWVKNNKRTNEHIAERATQMAFEKWKATSSAQNKKIIRKAFALFTNC
ncbi:hypothetical protein PCYB_126950, partial [Plasmodium cynomolgi strain B]